MDIVERNALIAALPVRQLIAVMRALNGGPLGYDYMKRSKNDLQTHAYSLADKQCSFWPEDGGSCCERTVKHIKQILTDAKAEEGREAGVGSVGVSGLAKIESLAGGKEGSFSTTEESLDAPFGSENPEATDEDVSAGDDHENGMKSTRSRAKSKDGGGEPKDGEQGEGKGKGDGKQNKGKQKEPRPAPTTPEDMLKEAVRSMVEEMMPEQDEPQKVPTPEEIEDMINKKLEGEKTVYKVQVKLPSMPVIEDEAKPRHAAFKETLQAVARGLNVLLVGPAGSGKTFMAEQVHDALHGKDGTPFRCTGAVTSEYKLLGFITAQGTLVRTAYRDSYEHGGVFLWDELDASAAQALLSFNSGLANGYQDFPDAIVKRHPNSRFIASANTYGNGADRLYVGRNQLDAASLDRFYMINMDYDEELERTLYCGVSRSADEWVNYVHQARKALRSFGGSIRHVVSMRAIDQGIKMIGSGISRGDVERAVLWKHLDKADVAKLRAKMAA